MAGSLAVGLWANQACAAFLTIIENGDKVPTVSTNLYTPGPVLFDRTRPASITTSPENARIDGFHDQGMSPSPVSPGMRALEMLEPGSNAISDIIILNALSADVRQELVVTFQSDSDGGHPLTLDPAIPFTTVVETGTLQDLSAALGTLPEGLIVNVQSDLNEIPEPASLILLGSTLMGAVEIARRKRRALTAGGAPSLLK